MEAEAITRDSDSESHNCYSKIASAIIASEGSQDDFGHHQSGIPPVMASANAAFSCEVARFGRSGCDPCGTIVFVLGLP